MNERKMTNEEAEALLTLVRGGWLKLELTPEFLPEQPLGRAPLRNLAQHQPEQAGAR